MKYFALVFVLFLILSSCQKEEEIPFDKSTSKFNSLKEEVEYYRSLYTIEDLKGTESYDELFADPTVLCDKGAPITFNNIRDVITKMGTYRGNLSYHRNNGRTVFGTSGYAFGICDLKEYVDRIYAERNSVTPSITGIRVQTFLKPRSGKNEDVIDAFLLPVHEDGSAYIPIKSDSLGILPGDPYWNDSNICPDNC